MTTVIAVAILVVIVVGIYTLLVTIDKKEKRHRMNRFLNRFSELGSEHNLSFSSHEILRDCILGLDGVHRKLLMFTNRHDQENGVILIDLAEVKSCSLRKTYGMINGGELKRSRLENFLERMVLHFEFINDRQPLEIIFYNHLADQVNRLPGLEQRAKYWETILSKIVNVPLKNIA